MKYTPFFLMLLAGCSAKYAPPKTAETTATIKVKHLSEHRNSTTTVNVFDNQTCTPKPGYGRLALVGDKVFIPGKEKTVTVAAGNESYFFLKASGYKHLSGSYYIDYRCRHLVSFKPVAGEKYEIFIENPEHANCKAYVLNQRTNESVDDLVSHEVTQSCWDNYVY